MNGRAASPYTNDNSKWVEVTDAVTRIAVNNVDGLSVLPVDDAETNEELALQIAMDPTIETSKEFDEKRALQKAKLLSRLRNESDVDIADVPASANGFPTKMEGMGETDDRQDDVFIVELEKGDDGIGLGLIDGLVSSLFLHSYWRECVFVERAWPITLSPLSPIAQRDRVFHQLRLFARLPLFVFLGVSVSLFLP